MALPMGRLLLLRSSRGGTSRKALAGHSVCRGRPLSPCAPAFPAESVSAALPVLKRGLRSGIGDPGLLAHLPRLA